LACCQVGIDIQQGNFASYAAALQRKAGARAYQTATANNANFHRFSLVILL